MIKVENLCKSFDDVEILKNISIQYEPGRCNLIIGASGSGKTVLLKNLIGLLEPDKGDIWYGKNSLNNMSLQEKTRLRQRIGILFQSSALFDFGNVLENVVFPMNFLTDWSETEKLERARFCLDRVNVQNAETKHPSELSGGMQKRVGIARAISLSPEFLFCDEPNSGLDPHTSILIDELIQDITEEYNITTVINTHDLNSVLGMGDFIGFISNGELIWTGDKTSILKTDCEELKTFLCANALAKNIIEGKENSRF